MVSHLDSLWNRDTRELGNGLLVKAVVLGFTGKMATRTNHYKSDSTHWDWLKLYIYCSFNIWQGFLKGRWQTDDSIMKIAYVTADGPTATLEVSEIFRAYEDIDFFSSWLCFLRCPLKQYSVLWQRQSSSAISHSKNVFHIIKSAKWADFENGGC